MCPQVQTPKLDHGWKLRWKFGWKLQRHRGLNLSFQFPLGSLNQLSSDESCLLTAGNSLKVNFWNPSFCSQYFINKFQWFHQSPSANTIKSQFNRIFNKLSLVETVEILIKFLIQISILSSANTLFVSKGYHYYIYFT